MCICLFPAISRIYCKSIHSCMPQSKWFSFFFFFVCLFVCLFVCFRNYNYGQAGKDLKVDLLNHPEYIEQNSTLAFQVAIWRWMMPIKKHQPSAHDVFIGYWTPTKNDTLAKRVSGFGVTMNVLMGILFSIKVIMSLWKISSPITYITLILWVLIKKKQDLLSYLPVLSRLLLTHPFPQILKLCLVLRNSILCWTHPFCLGNALVRFWEPVK